MNSERDAGAWVAVGYRADVFEKASSEELAERRRIADRVREELAIAGLPTVTNDEHGLHGDVNGVLVMVDDGDDTAGGVILHWECSDRLTGRMVDAVASRRFDDPAIQHAGAVKQAMNAAVVQILTAAGFTVVENPNDMDPLSLNVRAAPARRAAGLESSWGNGLALEPQGLTAEPRCVSVTFHDSMRACQNYCGPRPRASSTRS